jgi:hypothetical protein
MRDQLRAIVASVGAPRDPFTPWIDAIVAGGGTPRMGPLRFDVLLSADRTVGLTLFDHGSGAPGRCAATVDPTIADPAVVQCLLSEGHVQHVGLRWSPSGFVLKFYRSSPTMSGLDVRGSRLIRRRKYHRVTGSMSVTHAELTKLPDYSHTIEARLDSGEAEDALGKTTTAVIFRPGASVDGLEAAAKILRPATSWTAPSLLLGPTSRAAALELDVYDDGREAFDGLITLGG